MTQENTTVAAKDLAIDMTIDLEGDILMDVNDDGVFDYENAVVTAVDEENVNGKLVTVVVTFEHQGGEIVAGFPPNHRLKLA